MSAWKTGALCTLTLALGGLIGVAVTRSHDAPAVATSAASQATLPTVKVAAAEQRNLPIYVSGIGRVQALNTAMVKSRVDGSIDKVLFVEGADVAAGEPLIRIDPRPYQAALAQAEGQLARDQAQYVSAKADLDRAVSLIDKGFASHQTLEQRQATVSGLAASVKIDQGVLDNAKLNLDFTTIRAPIAGRIGKRLVDTGNLVHGSDNIALAEIVQTHPISVLFTVPQGVLPELRAQMKQGALAVEAIATDDRHSLSHGTLALIGNEVDPLTGTVELKAAFDNDDAVLWPGQLIEARLTLAFRKGVVAVPVSAVAPTSDGKIVFVVDQNHKLSVRKVTLGPASEGQIMIETGLQPGEHVAIEKLDQLAPGLTIRPQSSLEADASTASPS